MLQIAKGNHFYPFQPDFEMNTGYYVEYKQMDIENHSTVVFYQFQICDGFENEISVIPDGCIDILISCNKQIPSANVCGSVLKTKRIKVQTGCEYFGVRFVPEQMAKNSNYTMKELVEQEIPLNEIVSINESVIERLIKENSFQKRISLFHQMFDSIFFPNESAPNIVRYALNKIYSRKGNISINELADKIGYSSRYLRKKFEESVGISPKLFSQIIRFQHSLHMILKVNNNSVNDIIMENGYYDQAHLINEFRKFGYPSPYKLQKKSSNTFF
ncbi:AraC family transcriptional regulator [Neobacillus sp. OS1-32]|uniref:helix-turn-helix domain-containing protein n=1 Tax=Neobacillus sp. OS1-32 TaxID=3070682 RepID=UPI0027E035BF|nr:AraC family transcriptional regulator [Neobacillus sp. OS1-32]WML31763.1 AraC family transcriptional regulator [Neobacillus sp. OS1-32]